MELPKKLCSFGVLDIILKLELFQKEVNKYNFNINKYNSLDDLECLFEPKFKYKNNKENFNVLDHISLFSENNLINTLLFINRSYKNKSFIEFIMPNQIQMSKNRNNIINAIKYILNKNYFFIIENKINNFTSSIKFIINIYKDYTKEIIDFREFQLYEKSDMDNDENISNISSNYSKTNRNIFKEINYNFTASDYFILDLNIFNDWVWCNGNDIYLELKYFLLFIINQNKNIKIITLISNIFFDENLEIQLKNYKGIIGLSDIIFSFKDNLNYFYQVYNHIYKNMQYNENSKILYNDNDKFSKDLILYDNDKYRKNIPRISILFNDLEYISIYTQNGINMELDYIEIFFLNLLQKYNNLNKNNIFYHFIGGFLSRFIYQKPFKLCASAGQLLLNKLFNHSLNYVKVDDFNIVVPNKRKSLDKKDIKKNLKEKNLKSNIKENNYNNNESYLFENGLQSLRNLGFIKRNNIILREPNNKRPYNFKNISHQFKTTNYFNAKQRNNSIDNTYERDKIKKRLIKNTNYLPKMQKSSSTTFINYSINKSKYYDKLKNLEKHKNIYYKNNNMDNINNVNNNIFNYNKLYSGINENSYLFNQNKRGVNSMVYNNKFF